MKRNILSTLFLILLLCSSALYGQDAKEESRAKIEEYRRQVLSGEKTMSVVASLYTEDPGSAQTGGLYRHVGHGQFVPEFEKVAFSMQPGQVSEVFETQYGFHFVQLVSRDGDYIDVRHVLVKF